MPSRDPLIASGAGAWAPSICSTLTLLLSLSPSPSPDEEPALTILQLPASNTVISSSTSRGITVDALIGPEGSQHIGSRNVESFGALQDGESTAWAVSATPLILTRII